MLMNFMFGSAWFGVYLNSGGAVHAMKELEAAEYELFKKQLFEVPSAVHEGKLLVDGMKGPKGQTLSKDQKIAIAWRHYAGAKLSAMGFGKPWERKYLELPEFFGYVGSYSEFHLGVRFPLIFCQARQNRGVPDDLWHLRGHIYLARRRMVDPTGRYNFVKQTPENSTVDLFDCTQRRGMEPLTQFLPGCELQVVAD